MECFLEPMALSEIVIDVRQQQGARFMHGRLVLDTHHLRKFECVGRFTVRNVLAWRTAIAESGLHHPLLCDATAVRFDVSSREVIAAAHAFAAFGTPTPDRLAFFVRDPLSFGLLRMFVSCLGPASELVSVFDDEIKARKWLTRADQSETEPGRLARWRASMSR